MNALATAPGVIATPGKYYIGAKEVMCNIASVCGTARKNQPEGKQSRFD